MQAITTIGLDIAKSVFQVHGVDAEGTVVVRRQLKRRYVLAFFQKLPPCLVGIEACASSHHWSRELQALGHKVRLMPPAYVKPYVKRHKNDATDAEAICEAVSRPNMRFVETKTPEQQSCLTRAGRSGDQDNPHGPEHCRMRPFDRDLIRGRHYGQRSRVPRSKAEHMAAPTNAAFVKKVLANLEPSTHGPKRRCQHIRLRSLCEVNRTCRDIGKRRLMDTDRKWRATPSFYPRCNSAHLARYLSISRNTSR